MTAVANSKPDTPFELFDPSWREAPLEAFRRLREGGPVYQSPSGYWVVSRYRDARRAMATPDVFSNACVDKEALGIPRAALAGEDPSMQALLDATFHGIHVTPAELASVRTVIGSDGDEHVRQRKLIDRAFSPTRVRALRPTMEAISAECAAKAATADSFDVMEDLAFVLPRRIIGELLAVEVERQPDLTRWTQEMMAATIGASRNTEATHTRLLGVLREFASYFVPRIDERRRSPKDDDFISDLVRAESDDRLTSLETLLLIRLLMIAGTDTTAALIGNTILELVREPDKAHRLRSDPGLIPSLIEESLRFWAPFFFVLRETTRETQIGGVTIPGGAIVAVLLGAANHDDTEFSCPAKFAMDRKSSHITFGHGVHFCVGSHLARAEALSAVTAILPYLDRFELADQSLELAESQVLQAFQRIPLIAK
jgi:cytochrome P450